MVMNVLCSKFVNMPNQHIVSFMFLFVSALFEFLFLFLSESQKPFFVSFLLVFVLLHIYFFLFENIAQQRFNRRSIGRETLFRIFIITFPLHSQQSTLSPILFPLYCSIFFPAYLTVSRSIFSTSPLIKFPIIVEINWLDSFDFQNIYIYQSMCSLSRPCVVWKQKAPSNAIQK